MTDTSAPETVYLIGSDDTEHAVARTHAMQSSTLRSILEGEFSDSTARINLPSMRGEVLDKVVEYLDFKYRRQHPEDAGNGDGDDNEDVDEDGLANFNIPTALSLDLLLAADYLDI